MNSTNILEEAIALIQENSFQEAYNLLKKGEFNDLENDVANFLLAVSLNGLEKHEEAINFFNQLLDKSLPFEGDMLTNMGIAQLSIGRDEEALEYFEKAEKILGKNPSLLMNIGVALSKLGEHRKAVINFESGMEEIDNDPLLWYNCAYSYIQLELYNEALDSLNNAE